MKQLSIAIVSPEFPPQIGGVERYAYEYARALAELGHRVTVFTRPHDGGEIDTEGLSIVPRLRRSYALDRKLVHEANVDAWHVMNAAYAWVACETSVPVVVTVHGNDFLRPYLPLGQINPPIPQSLIPEVLARYLKDIGRKRTVKLMTRGLEKASAILTNSRYTEQALLERFPSLKGRTVVGLVGVSKEHLNTPHKERSAEEPARLITISRLSEPRKNIHLVLEALAALQNEFDFTYRVIGDGAEKASLEALAGRLGLADRVSFCGRLPEDEMLTELAASDLFILCSSVLPTSHEGFGIVYLEANACGVPTLGARLAGAAEAIDEGYSGFFVAEPSTDSITKALRRFLYGEPSFESDACREFASQFTWARVVEKALPYYR